MKEQIILTTPSSIMSTQVSYRYVLDHTHKEFLKMAENKKKSFSFGSFSEGEIFHIMCDPPILLKLETCFVIVFYLLTPHGMYTCT